MYNNILTMMGKRVLFRSVAFSNNDSLPTPTACLCIYYFEVRKRNNNNLFLEFTMIWELLERVYQSSLWYT
jgi:hypothetical protein